MFVRTLQNARVTASDWLALKRYLQAKLAENQESELTDKFASFLLYQLKNNYLCENVRKMSSRVSVCTSDQYVSSDTEQRTRSQFELVPVDERMLVYQYRERTTTC